MGRSESCPRDYGQAEGLSKERRFGDGQVASCKPIGPAPSAPGRLSMDGPMLR